MKDENEITQGRLVSIERRIFLIRGLKMMLGNDLAVLYDVEPRVLIQAIKRNQNRFPGDFCFQLSNNEAISLKSQFVISKIGRGGSRHNPYVFTEHGVAMLSSVLRSERAVAMSVFIVRAFVKMREMLATNKELAHKMSEIEYVQEKQGQNISEINRAVARLIGGKAEPKESIGFKPRSKK